MKPFNSQVHFLPNARMLSRSSQLETIRYEIRNDYISPSLISIKHEPELLFVPYLHPEEEEGQSQQQQHYHYITDIFMSFTIGKHHLFRRFEPYCTGRL